MSDFTVIDNSPEVIAELKRKMMLALAAMGEVVEGYAKEECPVDTGRLRNSITHKTKGETEYIGTNVEYGKYVELIDRYHHKTGKAHFLRDAATTHGDELKEVTKIILRSDD